jgi:hypothetical protein
MVLAFRRPKTLYGACRCQEKTRHALIHFVTSLDCIAARLLSCSAALSGQSPEAACGAPKARGLTANARTEQEYRCRDVQTSSGRYAIYFYFVGSPFIDMRRFAA